MEGILTMSQKEIDRISVITLIENDIISIYRKEYWDYGPTLFFLFVTFHGHEELGARMMKKIFHRMKLPLHQLEYVQKLIRLHLRPIALANKDVTDSAIRRFVVNAGEDLEDLITLCRADITSKNPQKVEKYLGNYERVMQKVRDVKERDQLREFQSPVHGEEIMQICNLKPSKKVGEIKTAIEEAILDGKIGNNYEEALKYLMEIKDQFLDG